MSTAALSWFKRDLRLHDPVPLAAAQAVERTLARYVIASEWPQSPECDPAPCSVRAQRRGSVAG